MKILRWLIGIIVAVFILVVLAVVLLVNFVNPNDYKDQINKAVADATHLPFTIQGDIHWTIFPSLGFKVSDLSVGDDSGKTLQANVKTLEISLQLLPLLHKQTLVNALVVDGLQLTLPATMSQNTDNAETNVVTKDNNASASASPASAMAAISAAALENLSIANANITQLDANKKTVWAIKDLSLSAKDIRVNQAFPLKDSFTLIYPEKNLNATIKQSADVVVDMDEQTIKLIDASLKVDNAANAGPRLSLDLNTQEVTADLMKHLVDIQKLSGNVNGLHFAGNRQSIKDFDTSLEASGDVALQTESLKNFLNSLSIDMPNIASNNAATKFSLKTDYRYGENQLSLNPLTIQLDQNTINGSVKSADLKNMALNVSLQSPSLNLMGTMMKGLQLSLSLLPPPGENKNWVASVVNGNVSMQSVVVAGQDFSNVNLQVDGKNQVFKLLKLHVNAFRGSIDVPGVISLESDRPTFNLNPNIQGVQIADVLAVVQPKLRMSGVASIAGNLSGEGKDTDSIQRSLSGNLKVAVNNGVFYGMDVNYWLGMITQLYQNPTSQTLQTLPSPPQNAQTPFGNLTGTLNINKGVVSNQDLFLQGAVAIVRGQGTIDLNRQSLNYRMQIAKTNADTGAAHGDVIPLLITGTFDHPSVQPDMATIAKQAVNNVIQKQTNRLSDKLGQQLGDSQLGQQLGQQVGQTLGKLFGN